MTLKTKLILLVLLLLALVGVLGIIWFVKTEMLGAVALAAVSYLANLNR